MLSHSPNSSSHMIPVRMGKENARNQQSQIEKHVDKEKKPVLPVFDCPSDSHCSRYSGLFRCSVIVKENQYVMYYNGMDRPVLRADKQLTLHVLPKYYIFDISHVKQGYTVPLDKKSMQYVGKIRRDKNLDIHAFSLHPKRETVRSQQSLYIHYEFSLSDWEKVYMGKKSPRKARIALYHKDSDLHNNGNTLAEVVSCSMKNTKSLLCVAIKDSGLHVFSHKEPRQHKHGQYSLDFFGRCQLPSSSNMQLQDDSGHVLLQLAQSTNDTFHLDFRAPFNAFQAFGFAIAQLCDY